MTNIKVRGYDNERALAVNALDNPDGSLVPVYGSVQAKWRTDFSGTALNLDRWDVAQVGTGMTYSVGNGTLTLLTGTTPDDQITLLSKQTFTVPMRSLVAVNLSQRITGQTFFVEFISVDPATGLPDGGSAMSWRLDGISATQGVYETGTGSMPRYMSAASTIPTTAPNATGTAYSVLELEAFADENWWHGRVIDSSAARSNSYVRHQQILNPDKAYKLQLRLVNRQWFDNVTLVAAHTDTTIKLTRNAHGLIVGDTITVSNIAGVPGANGTFTVGTVVDANNFTLAGTVFSGVWIPNGWIQYTKTIVPASSTTINVNFCTVIDYSELTAEITAGRGNNAAGQGLSVNVNTMPTTTVSAAGQQADNSTTIINSLPVAVRAFSALPVTATSGRQMSLMGTLVGAAIAKPYSIPELDWTFAPASGGITVTTDQVLKAAGAAGIRNYVTGGTLINSGATPTEVVIKDGATVIWRILLPASMTTPLDLDFLTPLKGTAAVAMNFAVITASTVYANFQGYQAP